MGSELFEFAVVVVVAWLVWRLIAQRLKLPGQSGSNRDDYAGVGARLRPRPKSGAGAVALAEPDEDEPESSGPDFVPRRGVR
jgi:hypothetical protein